MIRLLLLALSFVGFPVAQSAEPPTGNVLKVLPLYLDAKGQSSRSPSLFERDAYQEQLRTNPSQRSTLAFEVEWKSAGATAVTVRLELRGSRKDFDRPLRIEAQARPSWWFRTWTRLRIPEAELKELGEVTAWRATLWSGDALLAERHSFLW